MQSVDDPRARRAWASLHERAWRTRTTLDASQTQRVLQTQQTLDRQKRHTQRAVAANAGALRRRERSRHSNVNVVAASDFLMAGIVEELARAPQSATVLGAKEVLGLIAQSGQALKSRISDAQVRSGVAASHLWCALAAQSAETLANNPSATSFSQSSGIYFASVAGKTMNAEIVHSVTNSLAPSLDSCIARYSAAEMLDATRIAASFICPAPERHDAVREECFLPLANSLLTGAAFKLPISVIQ